MDSQISQEDKGSPKDFQQKERMSNIEVPDKMTSNSPQHLNSSLRAQLQDEKISEEQVISAAVLTLDVKQELKEILVEVFDGAFTLSCGEKKDCNTDEAFDFFNSIEIRASAADIRPIKTQLQFLMGRAEDLQNQLAHTQDQQEREHLSTLVPTLLSGSQPVFTYLESRARSRLNQQPAGPLPSTSSSIANRLKVSMFRYHVATPFISRGGAHPGLFKRMRWNVEKLSNDQLHPHLHHHHQQQQMEEPEERQLETGGDTEYFFMCYEDIPKGVSGEEGEGLAPGAPATRRWSIGRWVQTIPDPDTEDIYDWALCEVPQARYLKLVSLGSKEPSVCHATDCLLGMLFPQQTGGMDDIPYSD
ncbi:unnamed protein product [Lota lota]